MGRKILKAFLYLSLAVVILTALLIAPIDRSSLEGQTGYQATLLNLDTIKANVSGAYPNLLHSTWAKVNITPSYPMPLAGYTLRDNFTTVHDSLFCRIIGFRSGDYTAYMLSVDLLLFPPEIQHQLHDKFINTKTFLFFSATHTHNGIGGWHNSVIGNLALGNYDKNWVSTTTENISTTINRLNSEFKPSTLSYWETENTGYAENRIDPLKPTDSKLRGLKIKREDNTKAILVTFSAHPTSINKKSLELSGDYPNALITTLENDTIDFGIYLSGMVGSHRLANIDGQEFDLVNNAAKELIHEIIKAKTWPAFDSIIISSREIPIQFGGSQLRIARDWKVRNWVFESLIGPLDGYLSVLQLGNIVLLGTPCDFSGEIAVIHKLDSIANTANKKLIITSFNGEYCGYITADYHYNVSEKEEIRALNWVGPYYGQYFAEMIQKVIQKK